MYPGSERPADGFFSSGTSDPGNAKCRIWLNNRDSLWLNI